LDSNFKKVLEESLQKDKSKTTSNLKKLFYEEEENVLDIPNISSA
jgi:hypothetical protein